MAKFLMDDGSTISSDKLMNKREEPKISPGLLIEIEMVDTLITISKNLSSETLNKDCIMQLIKGTQCDCEFNHNCEKCIYQWYMTKK